MIAVAEPAAPPAPASELDAGTTNGTGTDGGEPERSRAPWHFKLMMVALVVYLAFRFVQGVAWVIGHH